MIVVFLEASVEVVVISFFGPCQGKRISHLDLERCPYRSHLIWVVSSQQSTSGGGGSLLGKPSATLDDRKLKKGMLMQI
jgi:hypothetical protein